MDGHGFVGTCLINKIAPDWMTLIARAFLSDFSSPGRVYVREKTGGAGSK